GKIGTDAHGAFFLDSLARLGIGTHFAQSATPTAQVACLITPDGERTMRTFLGSVPEMTGADVAQGLFEGTRLALIEGYTLPNDRLTHQSMLYARDAGTKIAFSLASFEIVEAFKDVIHSLIEEHVSIVFANEAEAHALHGLSPRYCCQELSRHCEIAVVSEGAQGCYVAWEGQVAHCPALPVKAVDCTGAGDLFAAGFLHGWLQGLDPETCGRIGCILGAAIVQVPGAILPEEQWPRIREELGVVGLMGH
ncbi:MAG: adenosine kinase, partial [Chlamydiia bacterium]|nr:adenosine kinase [Chlamydiia bacterium]